MRFALSAVLLVAALFGVRTEATEVVDVLRSIGGLPPHIVGLFEEPLGYQQTPDGLYYVFDRRGHSVYMIDADKKAAQKVVEQNGQTSEATTPPASIRVQDVCLNARNYS